MSQGSTNQQHYPQRPPLSGIHVPEDYEAQDNNMNNQKERFFESLGLPPNLSDQSIKKFNQQVNAAPSEMHYMSGGPIETQMFKSAHQASGSLPGVNFQGNNFSNFKVSQQNHSSYKTAGRQNYAQGVNSDGSFLTCFDAAQSISQHQIGNTPEDAQAEQHQQPARFVHDQSHQQNIPFVNGSNGSHHQFNQDPLSASAHFPSRHTDSINGVMPAHFHYNQDTNLNEAHFQDSQRKHSAPLTLHGTQRDPSNNPFASGDKYQNFPAPINNNPISFNNTVHSIQPYSQQQQHQQYNTLKAFSNTHESGMERREILTITVDIGNSNGEQANIVIREGDDPMQLATQFAERHGIKSEQLRDLLAEQIQINMESVLREEEELAYMERQQQQVMSGVAAIQKQYEANSNQDNSQVAMTSPGIEILSGVDGSYDNRITNKVFDPYTGSSQNLLAKHSSGNLLLNQGTGSDQTQVTHSSRFQQQQQQPTSSQLNSLNKVLTPAVNGGQGFSNQDSNSVLPLRQSVQSSTQNNNNIYGVSMGGTSGTGGPGQQTTINSTVDNMYYNHYNNKESNNLHLNQSYNQYMMKQSLQPQRQGSYGRIPQMINQSFVSDSLQQQHPPTQQAFQFPGTQTYQQWKEQVSSQLRSQKSNHPEINDNSRKIIEHKRLLNNSGNASSRKKSGTVHTRLHQQAVSKQRQINGQYNMVPRNGGLGNSQLNVMSNGGGSTKNITRKVFNLNNSNLSSPARNDRFYPDSNFQRQYHPPRSSSAQEGRQSHDSSTLKPPIPTINYGERLYQKGLKRKEEQQRMLSQVRQQQEQDSMAQNCSFQPQINEISRTIAYPIRHEGIKTEEALINFGKQAREKVEQKRSEMLFKEIAECRFRPQIAKYTERILSRQQQNQLRHNGYESDGVIHEGRKYQMDSANRLRNSNSADKFSDLYKDAMRRRERQEKIYSACIGAECTFQPDLTVSKYYYQRLESRDPGYQQHKVDHESGVRHSQQPSQTRNHESRHFRNISEGLNEKERLQRSLKKSSTFSNDLFDPDSGLPYFRPRVGRGPRNQHRPDPVKEKGAIGDMLYNQSRAIKDRLENKKRMQDQEKAQEMKRVHTIDKSKYIIEEIKISHFADIFRRLDSDQDGNISCQRIDLSTIEGELLGVLEQIFTEMEELGQSLNEEEFIDATCRLYDALPLPQKRLLFNPKEHGQHRGRGSKQTTQANLYKPKLDPNSVKIATSKRHSNEDVTEILYRKKKEYEMKIMEKKQEKENLELVGCTFHPNIIQSPMSQNSSSAGGQGNKMYSRTNGGNGFNNSTMPGSRQSFSGAPGGGSLTGSQQPQIQQQNNHSQSFHGNHSQHTATFQRETHNNSLGLGNPASFGGFQTNFDLNTLALNVAQEYLRPPMNGGQQQARHQLDSIYNNNNRPPSVSGGNSLHMPPAPVPHPAQLAPMNTLDEAQQQQQRRHNQMMMGSGANNYHRQITLTQPVLQQNYAMHQKNMHQ